MGKTFELLATVGSRSTTHVSIQTNTKVVIRTLLAQFNTANFKQQLILPERGYQSVLMVKGFDRDATQILELDQPHVTFYDGRPEKQVNIK